MVSHNSTNFAGADIDLRENKAFLEIESHGLYNLIDDDDFEENTIILELPEKGIKFYTFTFG